MRLRALRSSSWLKFSLFAMLLVCTACSNSGNNSNNSGNNGDGSSAPAPPANPPAPPLNLTATGGNQQVSLAWTASTGATSYNVKRAATNGGPYTTVSSPTGTSYTDTSVTNGTTYYYVVTAVSANGESAKSNQASATPTATPSAPAAPTNLAATAGNQQVSLAWTAKRWRDQLQRQTGNHQRRPLHDVGLAHRRNVYGHWREQRDDLLLCCHSGQR